MEHKKLREKDYDIHYYLSGKADGKLIIFLHPAFSDHRAFDLQIGFFTPRFKVVTLDMLGHGLSQANKSQDKIDASASHIAKIIETEGYKKAHLVGVSMGSLIAQYFAVKYPEKVITLATLGGYSINKKNKELEHVQFLSNITLFVRALFSMKSFRKKVSLLSAYTREGQRLFLKSSEFYKRKSFLVMQGIQNVVKNRDNISLPYPILILTGEHDIPLAKKMAEQWHTELTNSEYRMIEHAGHCANMDNPERFNKLLFNFIESKQIH